MLFRFRLLTSTAALAATLAVSAVASAQTSEPAAGSADKTILVIGDSLSAEYGIKRDSGWVQILRQRLAEDYPDYRVINASISGDTSSGGAARAPAAIDRNTPAILILELGANDALRGLSLAAAEKNLSGIIERAAADGARTLIIGMMIPPNFGRQYAEQFRGMYTSLAKRHDAALVPFFFEGIALQPEFFLPDGIHPNEAAQQRLFDNVWPTLEPLLK